jgi:hypothetical protein
MDEMVFKILRLFGCYFIFKEGDISWRKRIHEPREAKESRSRQCPCVCSFISLREFYDYNHYYF